MQKQKHWYAFRLFSKVLSSKTTRMRDLLCKTCKHRSMTSWKLQGQTNFTGGSENQRILCLRNKIACLVYLVEVFFKEVIISSSFAQSVWQQASLPLTSQSIPFQFLLSGGKGVPNMTLAEGRGSPICLSGGPQHDLSPPRWASYTLGYGPLWTETRLKNLPFLDVRTWSVKLMFISLFQSSKI